jgi:hypothetical protein
MKKILFFCLAVIIGLSASAQTAKQLAPLHNDVRAKTVLDAGDQINGVPEKPITLTDATKVIQRIPFGSSFNMLTLLQSYNNNCVYSPALDYMMFTHRAGGAYGGASGDIRCHFTPYATTAIDSVVFLQQGNNRMRYPGGAIYNPSGNTNPDNAMAIITGPTTDGTNWKYNFFCTQKLDGSSMKFHFEETFDTLKPASINLTVCDGGKIKTCGKVGQVATSLRYPYYYYKGGQVQGDSVEWDANVYTFKNDYQDRLFSNDTTSWAFSPYMAFSQDGMIGYFYVIGWDAADNGINSGPSPIVWKTINGGTTWNKLPLLDLSTLSANMADYIKPTALTFFDPNPVYRPGIFSGSTVEETNFPGIVDMDGNLHIAVNIEGCASKDPDSLEYRYTTNPWNIFDLHTTSTGWDVNIVDTIHSGIDESIILTDDNMDHNYHVAKNSTGSKIFFMWTDTDLDVMNIMPDIYAKGFDLSSGNITATKRMTYETDYYLFNAAQQVVETSGSFFLPATFATITGTTIDAEPTHTFIKGLEFIASEFVGISENENASISSLNVYPNPTSDFANIDLNLTKTSNVTVKVINLVGQSVITKNFGQMGNGNHTLSVAVNQLTSGIYFFTVEAGSQRITKKIIVD